MAGHSLKILFLSTPFCFCSIASALPICQAARVSVGDGASSVEYFCSDGSAFTNAPPAAQYVTIGDQGDGVYPPPIIFAITPISVALKCGLKKGPLPIQKDPQQKDAWGYRDSAHRLHLVASQFDAVPPGYVAADGNTNLITKTTFLFHSTWNPGNQFKYYNYITGEVGFLAGPFSDYETQLLVGGHEIGHQNGIGNNNDEGKADGVGAETVKQYRQFKAGGGTCQ